ncbi:hypothetical protein [Carnobacterium maltaromaticum]|uniref:hypothetical protein n=1 Tax=Carnobacterium maltaromaticum TaxID=2751 RepID=UPI001071646C|nr:hypothetical protein [Carnobacterium maltaromaticum]TFJ71841.1 hypothetical protein CKN94_11625 [Carnobacterium maltaromaticum]TFJ76754.1 hypothetical protein CKN97_11615 [Carnobacterium maltaromaticum]
MLIISKYNKAIILMLVILSFGFYLKIDSSIQISQLIIYPIAVMMFLLNLINKRRIVKDIFQIFVFWMCWFILILFISIYRNNELTGIFAGIKNMIEPLIVISLFMFYRRDDKLDLNTGMINYYSKILVTMLILNTVYIFASFVIDLDFINLYFWGSTDSVAARAMTNGRYSGIFNQPMESGVAYSLGIFCWQYVNSKTNDFKTKQMLILIILIIGGVMSVSKVFLLIGLPLFFIFFIGNKNFLQFFSKFIIWGTLGVLTFNWISKFWSGTDYLLRFFNSSENIITLLTAGRFGEGSQQSRFFGEVWKTSPILGLGFGGSKVYDSMYFYFFSLGGVISLAMLIVLLCIFVVKMTKFIKLTENSLESRLFILLVLLISLGGFGSPILTLNRVGILLWTLLILLCKYFYMCKVDKKTQIM